MALRFLGFSGTDTRARGAGNDEAEGLEKWWPRLLEMRRKIESLDAVLAPESDIHGRRFGLSATDPPGFADGLMTYRGDL